MNDRDFEELRAEAAQLSKRLDAHGQLLVDAQESLHTVGASQAAHSSERRAHLNSFVAYILFTLLLGGAFFLLYRQRVDVLVDERDRLAADHRVQEEQLAKLSRDVAARKVAEEQAFEFYTLIKRGHHAEAIARFAALDMTLFTATERAVLSDGAAKARAQVVDAGYVAGIDAFERHDFVLAGTELERGLAYEDEGPRAAMMRYYLGVARFKTQAYQDAVHQLELALAGRVARSGTEDARFYLASALEQDKRWSQARDEYAKFVAKHPGHSLAYAARRKLAVLARRTVDKM